jgi:hypothetical protein
MLEFLAGTGLAAAAGLNAYVPMLALGLGGRLLDFVQLPAGWTWLENDWVLGILGLLLVIEMVADKIPAVDTVNDWIQTIVRPASGGIVFGGGALTETATVRDPAAFFESNAWIPVASGVLIAFCVHVMKALIRPALNAATFGMAAPVVSFAEDFGAVGLSLLALLLPILVIIALAGIVLGTALLLRRARRRKTGERPTAAPPTSLGGASR